MDQDEAMFGAEVKPKKKINLTKYFAITRDLQVFVQLLEMLNSANPDFTEYTILKPSFSCLRKHIETLKSLVLSLGFARFYF